MKLLKATILLLCLVNCCLGQGLLIKGTVKDTLNNAALPLTSIVLINTKDSTISTYTRADTNGNFSLNVDKEGKYIVRIAFPSFADYIEVLNIHKSVTDMGVVSMVSKEHLLKEFVLTRQVSAIKIKGDTTEYVADSFKVKENANVEDLLKRLPGIQVDKNGQITAQGETVQKILVDGEEFFSDDPKVVTKGLQANVVDKVQVYDKKSEQAEFTGVDDGQKVKTINLQLKEDRKKGFFGKADVAAGTDGYYQNQGMINAFKGKRQVSIFGINSNTDKVGLGWQDNGKFGGSNEMITDGEGNTYNISGNNDDGFSNWDGKYSGQGLPKVWTGGAHFANKWNEDKDHVTGNYRYGKQQVEVDGTTVTQYTLPGDTTNVSAMHQNQYGKGERHAIDGMYEWKIDSNNTIKISASAGSKTNEVLDTFSASTARHNLTGDNDTLYTNNRGIRSKTEGNFINAELLYKKKFAKKGRTISLDVKENYKDTKSDGHLYSIIKPDTLNPVNSITDQAKSNNVNTLAFSAKAVYTEPLSKVLNLEASYAAVVNNTTSRNYSYNGDGTHYNVLDSVYSNYYKYNIFTNSGGLSLRWVYKKVNFSMGSTISNSSYLQTNLWYADSARRYDYLVISPRANFKYKISNQRAFNFYYSGSTRQPTIEQVQPLNQNTDPTNITRGNPNLKQQFTNDIDLSFSDYKVLSNRSFWANISTNFVKDAISSSVDTRNGINSIQYVNVNGNYTVTGWVSYGFKLKKPEININLHVSPSVNHSINFINQQKNTNDNNSLEIGPGFSFYKDEKYEISFNPSITYYDNKATVSTYTTNYWQSVSEASLWVQLPLKFSISTEAIFTFRERTQVFTTNNDVIKWNAWVGKKFLKSGNLELRLSVFDILNQNTGNDRTAEGNIITQKSYNTIRRYGMINLIWNFTYKPGGEAKTEEEKK